MFRDAPYRCALVVVKFTFPSGYLLSVRKSTVSRFIPFHSIQDTREHDEPLTTNAAKRAPKYADHMRNARSFYIFILNTLANIYLRNIVTDRRVSKRRILQRFAPTDV